MKKQGIPADIVDLDGTKAFWMGNKDAPKLIIYFPGGGYCAPALSCHFQFLDELKKGDQDVGILLLAYGLAPGNQWPGQLRQAVLALQYAIETLHKRPSNIILQGDSAGAHLALAVLSHLAHPHPDTSIPTLSLTENIQGVLCLCPWIDFDTSYESYTRNANKDVFTARALARWAPVFLGDTSPDVYSHPSANSPPGWWGTVPVNRIFIGAGGDEILVDSIVKFAEAIKVCRNPIRFACISNISEQIEHKDFTFSCVPRDFHTVPINDFALGLSPGTQFNVMALWLKESFSRL